MTHYRYQAQDEGGRVVSGEAEADSAADVEQALREQGLEAIEVLPATPVEAAAAAWRLSPSQAEEMLAAVAELGAAQLPLAAGLRAAAGESADARVAAALRGMARDVEQGLSLEAIMHRLGNSLPACLRGLVLAATRTGRLGPALDELIAHQRALREIRWSIAGAIAYPLIVLATAGLLFLFLPVFVIPEFKTIFQEFGLRLPAATFFVIRLSDACVALTRHLAVSAVFALAVVFALACLWIPGLPGAPAGRRLLASLPLLGPLWHWSAAAAFARLLAILVDSGVPLPEALRLTGGGVRDAEVRDLCGVLSDAVARGESLADALAATGRLPASLVPLVRWGEKTGELASGLRSASDMFLGRIHLRTELLRSVSPPIVFLIVILGIGMMAVSLFMPLVSLVHGLS